MRHKNISKFAQNDELFYQPKLFQLYKERFYQLYNNPPTGTVWHNTNINTVEFLQDYKTKLESLASKWHYNFEHYTPYDLTIINTLLPLAASFNSLLYNNPMLAALEYSLAYLKHKNI